jgi:hypothetical protein
MRAGGECENKIGCGGCNDKNNELIISGARTLHHHDSYPTSGHRHIPISGACHSDIKNACGSDSD